MNRALSQLPGLADRLRDELVDAEARFAWAKELASIYPLELERRARRLMVQQAALTYVRFLDGELAPPPAERPPQADDERSFAAAITDAIYCVCGDRHVARSLGLVDPDWFRVDSHVQNWLGGLSYDECLGILRASITQTVLQGLPE